MFQGDSGDGGFQGDSGNAGFQGDSADGGFQGDSANGGSGGFFGGGFFGGGNDAAYSGGGGNDAAYSGGMGNGAYSGGVEMFGGGFEYGGRYDSSYGSRLCGSFGSMCCGLILVPIIIVGIFANENDQVIQARTISLVKNAFEVSECSPQPGLYGKLIFATGCKMAMPELANRLPSPFQPFIHNFRGASLSWQIEILQWVKVTHSHTVKDSHGKSHTTYWYTYQTEWRNNKVYDGGFSYGHWNRGDFPSNVPRSGDINAPSGTVYAYGKPGTGFYLDSGMTSQLPGQTVYPEPPMVIGSFSWGWSGSLDARQLKVDGRYLTTAYGYPRVGDLRIWFTGTTASDISFAAEEVPNLQHTAYASLKAYPPQSFGFFGRKTYPLEKLEGGHYTKADFIAQYKTEVQLWGWLWRIALFIAMICACNCIFAPISVMADLLRVINYVTCCLELGTVLDNAAQGVIGCFSCLCATVTFMIVVTVCWILVHPIVAILMLAMAVAAFSAASLFYKGKKKVVDAREDFYLKIDA